MMTTPTPIDLISEHASEVNIDNLEFFQKVQDTTRAAVYFFGIKDGSKYFVKTYENPTEKLYSGIIKSLSCSSIVNTAKHSYLENMIEGSQLQDAINKLAPATLGQLIANVYNNFHDNRIVYGDRLSGHWFYSDNRILVTDFGQVRSTRSDKALLLDLCDFFEFFKKEYLKRNSKTNSQELWKIFSECYKYPEFLDQAKAYDNQYSHDKLPFKVS